ncbi:hypothetical protein DFJ73DRAFT_765194 [Zopfochytrium polystomum]|nr:hypothetical protein DFJ73DRAFT_765194 [Zopfochytrium polystomum]
MGGVIGIDRFIATIDLEREAGFVGGEGNPASEELFIELAVRAELASSSFWDSNSGLNHRAHLKRMRRAPTPVNKSPSHKSRSKGRPASFAGVGSDLLGGTSVVRTDAAKAASAQALALANAAIAASEAARISREFEELRRSNSGLNVADTPSPPRRSQSFNGFGQLARAAAAADLPFSSPPVRQNRPGPASTTPQPSASSTEVRISITTPFSSVIMPAPDQPSESVPAPSSPALPGQSTQSAPQYPYAKPHSYHQPPHQPSHHHHHHQQPHPHQPNHLHPHFPHHHLPPSRSMSASRLNQKHLSLPLTPPSPGKTLQPILEAPLSSSTSSSVPANRSNSDKGSTGGVPGGARWLPQSHLRNSFVLDNNFDDASLAAAADLHRRRKRFSVEVMESSGPSSGDDGSLTLSPSPFSGGRYGSGAGAGSPATAAAGTASRLYGSSSDFEIPLSSWSSGVWGSSPPSAGW